MYTYLETAKNSANLKRIVVDLVSRVEGYGEVTLLLDRGSYMGLTEPLLHNLDVAIRAYDPCLFCATHAVSKIECV